jgi:hypothetical protein
MVEHKRQINRQIVAGLAAIGINQDQAVAIIKAATRGELGGLVVVY